MLTEIAMAIMSNVSTSQRSDRPISRQLLIEFTTQPVTPEWAKAMFLSPALNLVLRSRGQLCPCDGS
jgi:hypothetical protein